jgi:4-hydroxyphenylpyruvate dioxygenase
MTLWERRIAALEEFVMSRDLLENPLGTDGFEFVEFTGPDPQAIARQFTSLGFTAVARHRSKNVVRYRQGDINFILNMEPSGPAAQFRAAHGPSANAMAFRVKDAGKALKLALERGAQEVKGPVGPMELNIPAIEGIGGSYLYLVDRYGAREIYEIDFVPIEGAEAQEQANSVGLTYLDHLTHNVNRGNMSTWADFYERVFNFRQIRYFDIEGKVTGLFSKAMTSPCGKIRIPLNESQDDKSQIEEFLHAYRGEGIQHLALGTDNIYQTVQKMRARGMRFQDTVETYFDGIDARVPGHGESVQQLRENRILIDGAPTRGQGLLLQIFTENAIGPIFFEIIQRKGNEGFGEGNFKALFESLELDQIRRGVLTAGPNA